MQPFKVSNLEHDLVVGLQLSPWALSLNHLENDTSSRPDIRVNIRESRLLLNHLLYKTSRKLCELPISEYQSIATIFEPGFSNQSLPGSNFFKLSRLMHLLSFASLFPKKFPNIDQRY